MSIIKKVLGCQMSVTKPCIDMGFLKCLYISVANLCNLVTRYTFDKLIPKLTQYTSYEVIKLAEVGHTS
jgi:uncharacterized membrane protein